MRHKHILSICSHCRKPIGINYGFYVADFSDYTESQKLVCKTCYTRFTGIKIDLAGIKNQVAYNEKFDRQLTAIVPNKKRGYYGE